MLYWPFSQSVHEANVAAILENGHSDEISSGRLEEIEN